MKESRIFVIVEAKRFTTNKKIDEKIDQLAILKSMLDNAKNTNTKKPMTSKFKQTILAHKLDKISEVYLYIGGPYWEVGAIDKIKALTRENANIGYINMS